MHVKSNKNDRNDAEAICEAVGRPTMRFVPPKSPEQLAIQALHRIRQRLVRSRTRLVNQIRGILAEHGTIELDQFGLGLHNQHSDQRVEVIRRTSHDLGKSPSQPPDVASDDDHTAPQTEGLSGASIPTKQGGRASNCLNGSRGFVRDIPGEHSPDDTGILVGKRHGRDVRMTTLAKASKPTASRILLAPSFPKSSASAVDHQRA